LNRKNLLSALMALIMVISLVTIIVLPTGAAVDLSKVAPVTSATGNSSAAQEFKISTVDELIYAGEHPTYFSNGDVIYLANDLDISTYGPSFGLDFLNFNPAQDGKTEMNIVFDGLGHTIYNYKDDRAFFFGRQVNVIQNLNFVNAEVIAEGRGACVLLRTVERHVDIFNCHVRDSYCSTNYGGYNGVLVGLVNNGTKSLTIANCTVSNTSMNVDYAGVWASGLLVGRYGSQGSLIMRNCMAVNCDMTFKTTTAKDGGGGLLVGEIYNTSYDEVGIFDNVGTFGCTYQSGNCNTSSTATVTVAGKSANTLKISFDHVYAAGNRKTTGDGTYTPIEDLFYNFAGEPEYTLIGENYMTDDTVVNVIKWRGNDAANKPVDPAKSDPTFGLGGALLLMNQVTEPEETEPYIDWGIAPDNSVVALGKNDKAPMKMVFNKGDGVSAFYTDINGTIATDDVSYQLLRKDSWKDEDGKNYFAKSLNWQELVFSKPTTFNAHELTVTSYGDGTHSVVCLTEDNCVDNHINVACSGILVGEREASYYGQAAKLYVCSVCGYEWEEEISYEELESPVLLNYDRQGYEMGENVKVGLGVNNNTHLAGFSAYVEYNHALLNYKNYTIANNGYYCQINPIEPGLLKVVIVHRDATAVNQPVDWLTLNFTATTELTRDAEAPVSVRVEQAVTREEVTNAANSVGNDIFNNYDDDAAMLYGPFTAGDVDGNGVVELLDAILLIEKLEGSIDVDNDSEFVKRAANVDGDAGNEVNTADITYLLRYLADWDGYTLNPSAPDPVLDGVIVLR